ncbi:MAG TPA: T9SS type A sorting domain-containing protein, partial [Bacteroidia bacterium]
PPDDGTGNPASTLYTGYTGDASGNHRPWLMNIIIWLAEGINCGATDVNNIEDESSISIFPNPTDGKINLSMSQFENTTIKIYNLVGECIHSQIITSPTSQIDLTSQSDGIYFLQTNSGGKHFTSKLIIQH